MGSAPPKPLRIDTSPQGESVIIRKPAFISQACEQWGRPTTPATVRVLMRLLIGSGRLTTQRLAELIEMDGIFLGEWLDSSDELDEPIVTNLIQLCDDAIRIHLRHSPPPMELLDIKVHLDGVPVTVKVPRGGQVRDIISHLNANAYGRGRVTQVRSSPRNVPLSPQQDLTDAFISRHYEVLASTCYC